MNRMLSATLFALSFSLVSHNALADCNLPAGPIIPDGNVASEDELISAQKAMKLYQESLLDYRECLDAQVADLDPEAETTEAKKLEVLALFNASIESEERVANEFNQSVRAYKARQPQ